jgi:DNA-binding transcriptional regulator YiaG
LSALADDLGVRDASEDDLYAAMDWLLDRQARIEQTLAARHLAAGGLVLYDLTSSYLEGTTRPLAKRGHNRDGKRDKLQVNYGLLTDRRGCPVAVSVFDGNVSDSTTLLPQVTRLREDFGIGDAADFLALTPEEAALVETKLALSGSVRDRRMAQGLSQAELAKRLKSSQSRIAKVEAADPTVSADLLLRALFALGATPGDVASAIRKRRKVAA